MNLERIISLTLRVGVILSSVLVVSGLTLFYIEGGNSHVNTSMYSLVQLFEGLTSAQPVSLILVGVIVLVATPTLRVLELVLNYVWEKDRLYVLLSGLVLALMLTGIIVVPLIR
ncbi:MAG: DUF1634 domain-containing protein [Thermoprotei archaeon]